MAQPPGGSDPDRLTSPGDTPAAQQDRAGPGQQADTRFALSPVPLALIAEDGQILDVNPALAQLLNQPPQQVIGRPMIELTHPDDVEHTLAAVEQVADGTQDVVEIDKRINVAGARPLPVRVTLLLLEEPGGQRHRLAHVQDASAPAAEQELVRQAEQDPLTGLGNRRALHDRLGALLAPPDPHRDADPPSGDAAVTPVPGRRPSPDWSVLFIDLDGFKAVNDTHGHRVDQVLVAVGRRLARVTRDDDLMVRLGGDEFVLLLATADPAALAHAEQRIRRSLAQPFAVDATTVRITASIGSATPRPDDSADQLLERADRAMYRDKNRPTAPPEARPGSQPGASELGALPCSPRRVSQPLVRRTDDDRCCDNA